MVLLARISRALTAALVLTLPVGTSWDINSHARVTTAAAAPELWARATRLDRIGTE